MAILPHLFILACLKSSLEFYQKVGYTVVGVVPDANGLGKPDILMAKRIADG